MPTSTRFVLSRCRLATVLLVALFAGTAFFEPLSGTAFAQAADRTSDKLDSILATRAVHSLSGRSRVIVEFAASADSRVFGVAGQAGKRIGSRFQVGDLDNYRLLTLAADSRVTRVMIDRPTFATLERVNAAIGATVARQEFGVTGRNVGIAVIDSGVTAYHDDLFRSRTGSSSNRIAHFKDFTQPTGNVVIGMGSNDPYGHGTHVAGIIAGSGYDSRGARSGVAPGAKIVALKVLDEEGQGYISDVIAAIDYAIAARSAYNIRVINLSVASGVFESYANDPLTLAARRAVNAGIVVVAAAGNLGQTENGETQFGGITSPGNAPWVLTVGASNHNGTSARSDDTVGAFSSRGPTWINFSAKPDLIAPGVGIESLSNPLSTMFAELPNYLIAGSILTPYKPYLSLSGTSMAAPVVAGTVALMLEVNPSLTPNAVKALLQYSAQVLPNAHALSQGAGMLNAKGALRLAAFFRSPQSGFGNPVDTIANEQVAWSQHIVWGNFRVSSGVPLPRSNAWDVGQTWGVLKTAAGQPVVWGAESDDNIVWSTGLGGALAWATSDDNIVWSTGNAAAEDNIVWSTHGDDNIVWSTADGENIVWSTDGDDNIVWSTSVDNTSADNSVRRTATVQNVIWGNDCGGRNCPQIVWGSPRRSGGVWGSLDADENIVWSTNDDENIVWSTDADDNIVWSTWDVDDNIVWSTADDENIVWSTDNDDNIVWSTESEDNIVWSTDDNGNIVWSTFEEDNIVWSTGLTGNVLWPSGK